MPWQSVAQETNANHAQRVNKWATDDGIYFGYQVEKPIIENRPLESPWDVKNAFHRYRGERHILTVGPNGSGKTRRLLITNLFHLKDWSVVAIDPKGELVAHTAAYRANMNGHRVIVIDPFSVITKNYPRLMQKYPDLLKSHGFNPVAALDPSSETFVDDAKALAEALIKTEHKGEKYWALAARALVKGIIMGLRLDLGADASLAYLRLVLGRSPEDLAVFNTNLVNRHGKSHPEIAASLSEFMHYNPEDRELGAIRRTAKVQTDWLDSPRIGADLQHGTFNFASIKRYPTTIFEGPNDRL
jgi:type IV secretion system protein VirD4